MKKRRRIELTTFRRRTAIVLRDNSEAQADGEASHRLRSDTPRPLDIDPDQACTTDEGAEQFGLDRGRDANDRKRT